MKKNNLYENLELLKTELFDSPDEIKKSFNTIVEYFSNEYFSNSYKSDSYNPSWKPSRIDKDTVEKMRKNPENYDPKFAKLVTSGYIYTLDSESEDKDPYLNIALGKKKNFIKGYGDKVPGGSGNMYWPLSEYEYKGIHFIINSDWGYTGIMTKSEADMKKLCDPKF